MMMNTADPYLIAAGIIGGAAVGGTKAGLNARKILDMPKDESGKLTLTPEQQKAADDFNQQWKQMDMSDHIFALSSKTDEETQAILALLTPENQTTTLKEIADFGKMTPQQQADVAQKFKDKQAKKQAELEKQQKPQADPSVANIQAQSDAMNRVWEGVDAKVHMFLLQQKSQLELEAFVPILTPENQQKLQAEVQAFHAMSDSEQKAYLHQGELELQDSSSGSAAQPQPPAPDVKQVADKWGTISDDAKWYILKPKTPAERNELFKALAPADQKGKRDVVKKYSALPAPEQDAAMKRGQDEWAKILQS